MVGGEGLARDGDAEEPGRAGNGLEVSDGCVAAAVSEGGRTRGEHGVEDGGGAAQSEAERESGDGERLTLEAGREEEAEVGRWG